MAESMNPSDIPPIGEEPPNLNTSFIDKVRSTKSVKSYGSGHKCIGCGQDSELSDLLPSSAGSAWRKCPKCQMNFQVA